MALLVWCSSAATTAVTLETRGKLVRVLSTSVPFLSEIEEVRLLPGVMLAIARQGIPSATSTWLNRERRHDVRHKAEELPRATGT